MSTALAIELSDPAADHEAELAAIVFLARYGCRTLDSCRYDLRSYFQRTAGVGLDVRGATCPRIRAVPHLAGGARLGTSDHRLADVPWKPGAVPTEAA
jgi:hypothetical protein